jgi:hypothetical protein
MEDLKTDAIGISIGQTSVLTAEMKPNAKPAVPIVEKTTDQFDYVRWGESNDTPKQVIDAMSKNEILYRANEFNKSVHAGAGITYYREVVSNGQRYIEFFEDAEIDEWMLENEVNTYLYKAFVEDYETLGNIFPEHVLTANRQRIGRLFRQDAAWCRWGKQDKAKREVLKLYINSDWEAHKKEEDMVVDVLNTKFPLQHLQQTNTGYNFIQRIRPVSNGRYYYEMCNTEVIINSKTLEIAADIKRTLRALLKNQANMVWHIEVTEEYMESQYGKTEWLKIKDDKERRRGCYKEVRDQIDKYLAGADNAGKTLLTGCYYDKAGNKISGVHITPLKNQIEKGAWIPDQQQLANEIFMGMGVDPSSVGGFANQNRTMNSGSEKKNSFSISTATFASDQMITLAPFVFVARYNGWYKRYPNLRFGVLPPASEVLQPNTSTNNAPAS